MKQLSGFYKGIGIVFIFIGLSLFSLDLVHGSSRLPVTWIVYVLSGTYLLIRDKMVNFPRLSWLFIGVSALLMITVILSDMALIPDMDLDMVEIIIPLSVMAMDLDDIEKKAKERKNVKD